MAKHDRAEREKRIRNALYALRYRQLVCKICKHRSCKKGRCINCGAEAKERKPRRRA